MRIAICDDDINFDCELKQKLYEYSNNHNLESVVDVFESGEKLIASKTKFDLIIMDYKMDGMDGLQTASVLRKGINRLTCIIFLTSYPEIAISAYAVDTYRFVVKSSLYKGLFDALDDFRKTMKSDYGVRIKSEGEYITISSKDIVFAESHNKVLLIHLLDGTEISTTQKLTDFLKNVPSAKFCQIHKSYVINMEYITKQSGDKVELMDYTLQTSRTYGKQFAEKYLIFLRDNR